MLLGELFLRNGQLGTIDEIGERVFVQDTDSFKRSAFAMEVDPVLAGTKSKGRFPVSFEGTKWLFWMIELVLGEVAERIDHTELLHGWKLFQFLEGLIAESYLKHGDSVPEVLPVRFSRRRLKRNAQYLLAEGLYVVESMLKGRTVKAACSVFLYSCEQGPYLPPWRHPYFGYEARGLRHLVCEVRPVFPSAGD